MRCRAAAAMPRASPRQSRRFCSRPIASLATGLATVIGERARFSARSRHLRHHGVSMLRLEVSISMSAASGMALGRGPYAGAAADADASGGAASGGGSHFFADFEVSGFDFGYADASEAASTCRRRVAIADLSSALPSHTSNRPARALTRPGEVMLYHASQLGSAGRQRRDYCRRSILPNLRNFRQDSPELATGWRRFSIQLPYFPALFGDA